MNNGEKKKYNKKAIVEWFAVIPMLILLIVFGIRIFRFNEKPFASQLIWSDEAIKLYNEDPDEFVIYTIPTAAVSKGLDYTLSGNKVDDTTNYTVSNIIFYEKTQEIQFTVKYPVRDLLDKNVILPYKYVLEDDERRIYVPSDIKTEVITGYVYCRVTVPDIDIFATNTIAFLLQKDGETVDARLMYSTLDRIADGFTTQSIAYSQGKYKLSFMLRIADDKNFNENDTKLIADGNELSYTVEKRTDKGLYETYFIETSNIDLINYEAIDFFVGDNSVRIYDVTKDKTVYEDLSTEDYECAAFYVQPDDLFVTPVKVMKFDAPNISK